jgi:hypothetical protein
MKEKQVIEAYYERLRQKMKKEGTYDSTKAHRNGMGGPELGRSASHVIRRKQGIPNQAEVMRSWGGFYHGIDALNEATEGGE